MQEVASTGTGALTSAIITLAFVGVGTMSGTASLSEPNSAAEQRQNFPRLFTGRTSEQRDRLQRRIAGAYDVNDVNLVTELAEPMNLSRPDTVAEQIIGELREWILLDANWDGEGASNPIKDSIAQTVKFVKLLGSDYYSPEPMLLSSGRAGLYWNENDLYADLEFTGKNSITYFIDRAGKKYKGVVDFDAATVPPVFRDLLQLTR